jgi:hypothetical protein
VLHFHRQSGLAKTSFLAAVGIIRKVVAAI